MCIAAAVLPSVNGLRPPPNCHPYATSRSKELEGPASWALPQLLAVCHELSPDVLKGWMGGLDALAASCRERGAIHVTGRGDVAQPAWVRGVGAVAWAAG